MKKIITGFGMALLLFTAGCQETKKNESKISDNEIVQAYDYMITRYLVQRQEVIDIAGDFEYNKIIYNELGKATFANPNLDVAYLEAWVAIDENSPVIIEVPEIKGRYYTAQFLDEWNETFANINPRNYPDKPFGKFALCLEGVDYKLEDDITRIDMPSKKAHLLGRIELQNTPEDAVKIQNQFKMYVYKEGTPQISKTELEVFPLNKLMGVELFELAEKTINSAKDVMPSAKLFQEKVIAISEAMKIDPKFKSHVNEVCKNQAVPYVLQSIKEYGTLKNGWGRTDVIGVYGDDYKSRTVVSLIGIWANVSEEVIYYTGNTDANKNPLEGKKSYEIRFKKDELPSKVVNDFWSIILVDGVDYFVVANELNHFNFNNYSNLTYEENGDLVIFCGTELLDGYHKTNWLPTPKDMNFSLTIRCYGPKQVIVDGTWFAPEITLIN
jgi:hypothetical protein